MAAEPPTSFESARERFRARPDPFSARDYLIEGVRSWLLTGEPRLDGDGFGDIVAEVASWRRHEEAGGGIIAAIEDSTVRRGPDGSCTTGAPRPGDRYLGDGAHARWDAGRIWVFADSWVIRHEVALGPSAVTALGQLARAAQRGELDGKEPT